MLFIEEAQLWLGEDVAKQWLAMEGGDLQYSSEEARHGHPWHRDKVFRHET